MALGCGKRLKILHHLFLLGSLGYPWLVSVLVFKGWQGGASLVVHACKHIRVCL